MNIKYMELAINEAKKAAKKGEIPVGAVIVKDDKIVAKAHNLKEKKNCCVYHAEILAIMKACGKSNNWRLNDCDMYITFEPCPMCASAIRQSRIKNVYCGLSNLNKENFEKITKIFTDDDINPGVTFYNDLCVEKIQRIMRDFFKNKRL